MALTITAVPDPSSRPPATSLTVDPDGATTLTIWRDTYGERVIVRGAEDVAPTGTFFVVDYESAFGVPVTYVVTTYNADGTQRATATTPAPVTLVSTEEWLSDPLNPNLAMPILVSSYSARTYHVERGLHSVIGRRRPVAVHDTRHAQSSGNLVLLTLDRSELDQIRDIFDSANPVLLRTLAEHDVGAVYFSVGDIEEQRVSPIGAETVRLWSLDVVEVDSPVQKPIGALATWEDVLENYSTWGHVLSTEATWLDVLSSPWPETL